MPDLIYVFIMVAFFAIASALVRLCDRIIGPDELLESASLDAVSEVAA